MLAEPIQHQSPLWEFVRINFRLVLHFATIHRAVTIGFLATTQSRRIFIQILVKIIILILIPCSFTDWLISLSVFCSASAHKSLSNPISLRTCNVRGFTHFEFFVLTKEFLARRCSRPNFRAFSNCWRRSCTNAIASLILLAHARSPVRASVFVKPETNYGWISLVKFLIQGGEITHFHQRVDQSIIHL